MRVPLRFSGRLLQGTRLGSIDLRRLASRSHMSRAEHARAVSLLQVFGTTKHTGPGRHARTDESLVRLLNGPSRILDLGASDGSTSLDFMERLGAGGLEQYFVTDRSFEISAHRTRTGMLFSDSEGRGIALALPGVVLFPQHLPGPLRALCQRFAKGELVRVSLAQPELLELRDYRVVVRAHDVFTPWPGPKVHVVKIANLLNRVYFTDARIEVALGHIFDALEPGGLLAIIDNRQSEQSSIYRRHASGFTLESRVGRGTDIDDLVTRWASTR